MTSLISRLSAALLGIGLGAATTAASGTAAFAQVGCPPNAPQCEVTNPGAPGSPGGPGGGSPGSAGDPNAAIWRYFRGAANELSQTLLPPGTTQCYNTGLGGNMTLAAAMAAAFSQPDAPGCPDLSGIPAIEDVRAIVAAMVPPPDPQIRPGRNVTGLEAYLETGLEEPEPQQKTVGPVTLTFTLELDEVNVDWGDGSPEETYDRPGVPYQERDGRREITHVYERSGREACDDPDDGRTCWTVTVDAVWAWTAEVTGGPQTGLRFSGEYIDPREGDVTLPVEQVQAVRNR